MLSKSHIIRVSTLLELRLETLLPRQSSFIWVIFASVGNSVKLKSTQNYKPFHYLKALNYTRRKSRFRVKAFVRNILHMIWYVSSRWKCFRGQIYKMSTCMGKSCLLFNIFKGLVSNPVIWANILGILVWQKFQESGIKVLSNYCRLVIRSTIAVLVT